MFQGEEDGGGHGPQGGRGRGRNPLGGRGRGRGGPSGPAFDPSAPRRNVWKRGDPPMAAAETSNSGGNASAAPFRPGNGGRGTSSFNLNASAASFKPANGATAARRTFPGEGPSAHAPHSFQNNGADNRGTKKPAVRQTMRSFIYATGGMQFFGKVWIVSYR